MEVLVAGRASVEIDLMDVDHVVVSRRRPRRFDAGHHRISFRLRLPSARRHGYGIRARLTPQRGDASPAGPKDAPVWASVEAIEGWWESPRHVALTSFRDPTKAPRLIAGARAWHVTVAQAYDWMYRHYRYEAPTESFLDALGRRVSHRAVRALVDCGHAAGIATLAYGSVYGAEPEYAAAHPDERVFDATGEPLSLGGAFFINDLRPGSPWRTRLLREYVRACRRFGFDGIHMDTYGPPHEAVAADGTPIHFDELYPDLIDEAAARVEATGDGRRVLFNCVEGFPLEVVAARDQAALYLELWPPDDRYADLVRWIDRARAAGNGKAIVIAAYVPALRDAGDDPRRRARAVESAILLTTVISAAGASHHMLADGERILVEGYYPAAVRLRADEAAEIRVAWVFGARYLHLLSDPMARARAGRTMEIFDRQGVPVPVTATPEAGAVWMRVTSTTSGEVVSLVDLRAQLEDRWDAEREAVEQNTGWVIRWPGARSPVAMSPWTRSGSPRELRRAPRGEGAALPSEPSPAVVPVEEPAWRLPSFRRWLVIFDRG
ncbi:MAG: glycoside hydrolase family 66 protein [Candidatus Limnocylindrales bacterium]